MELISNILLTAASLAAAFYCYVLSARLKKFNSLEKGVGGAVSVLSAQVQELTETVTDAKSTAEETTQNISSIVERAEKASKQIEIQLAALNGLSIEGNDETEKAPPLAEPIFTRRAVGV